MMPSLLLPFTTPRRPMVVTMPPVSLVLRPLEITTEIILLRGNPVIEVRTGNPTIEVRDRDFSHVAEPGFEQRDSLS